MFLTSAAAERMYALKNDVTHPQGSAKIAGTSRAFLWQFFFSPIDALMFVFEQRSLLASRNTRISSTREIKKNVASSFKFAISRGTTTTGTIVTAQAIPKSAKKARRPPWPYEAKEYR